MSLPFWLGLDSSWHASPPSSLNPDHSRYLALLTFPSYLPATTWQVSDSAVRWKLKSAGMLSRTPSESSTISEEQASKSVLGVGRAHTLYYHVPILRALETAAHGAQKRFIIAAKVKMQAKLHCA